MITIEDIIRDSGIYVYIIIRRGDRGIECSRLETKHKRQEIRDKM